MILRNATALVTGGTSGIGLGIAKALTAAGTMVAITGRTEAKLRETAKEIGAVAIRADVTDEADAVRTVQEAVRSLGHLDILVNPSEVITNFGMVCGTPQTPNPTKLQPEDIAHMVKAMLKMDDRGFTTELTIFATNPKDLGERPV
jgi:NAD(P)-dependent dehydrogenase (short-subunit alcohol dehydrogenase family)